MIDKTKLPDEYSVKNLHREAHIMRMIDHPNIIQLFEVMETKKSLFLVLEHAAGGEVLDLIMSKGKLSEEAARNYVRQIVSALVSLKVDLQSRHICTPTRLFTEISRLKTYY